MSNTKRVKVFTKTAKKIFCKYTNRDLTQVIKKNSMSRAMKKLPNGEYMILNADTMKKHLDELYPEEVEHEGENWIKDDEEKIRRIKRNLGYDIE